MQKTNEMLTQKQQTDLLDVPRSIWEFKSNSYSPSTNPDLLKFMQCNALPHMLPESELLPEELVAGKNTYVYDAHTYHTKVPPQAIARLIEHYAEPGGIVLDPFCGSGMTGVAALQEGRKPILIDLSPAATFIALNFVTPIDALDYWNACELLLSTLIDEEFSLYGTHCRTCGKLVPMDYMVWSYGLICSHCGREIVLWDVARDEHDDVRQSKIRTEFDCPHCGKHLRKRQLQRTQLYPVQVGYHCCQPGRRESVADPDAYDLSLVTNIEQQGVPRDLWYPTSCFPQGVNTRQPISQGLNSVDSLYTTRQLRVVARLWDIARRWSDPAISLKLLYTVTSLYQRVTKLSEFRFWGGSGNIANYNVPMIFNEQNVFKVFERKAKTIRQYFATWQTPPSSAFCISTQSATDLNQIPDNSVDFIFTDPPFGANINYSEMNFLWESWLGVFTDAQDEAIINRVQGKSVDDYQDLMAKAFCEMHRVLKEGRWLTIVFHNSSAEVWAAIQKAIAASGFAVESTQTLDKQHGTFKQFVSPNAVGYDLVLHCQKKPITASAPQDFHENHTSRRTVEEFLNAIFVQNPEAFVVKYLHVEREDEIDGRKLYSLWLRERFDANELVDLSYEEFRRILKEFVQSMPSADSVIEVVK